MIIDYPIFFKQNGIKSIGALKAKDYSKIKKDSSNCYFVNHKIKKIDFVVILSRINLFTFALKENKIKLIVEEENFKQTNWKKKCNDGYVLLPKLTIVFVEMTKKRYDEVVNDSNLINDLWDKSKNLKLGVVKKEGSTVIIEKRNTPTSPAPH